MKKCKLSNIIICCLFFMFLIFLVLSNFIRKDISFSDTENRYLAQMPVFSIKKLLNGSFSKDFEFYIQDQFLARDFWVTLKTQIEVMINKKDLNGAYIGSDGWYFEKKEVLESNLFEDNISAVSQFADWAKERDITTTFLPVYSSHNIYTEYMPNYANLFDEVTAFASILKRISKNISVVNIYQKLISHKGEYIFFKTDHHWTQLGSFYAYQELGSYMGFTPYSKEYFDNIYLSNDFYGSLYSKAPMWKVTPDKIETFELKKVFAPEYDIKYNDTATKDDKLYNLDNLIKKDKYTIFLDGNHSIMTINTNIDNSKKLLVIKDSFAHVLVPFLANHYNEISVIDLRYYKQSIKNYVTENDIDDILFVYNLSWFAENDSIRSIKY